MPRGASHATPRERATRGSASRRRSQPATHTRRSPAADDSRGHSPKQRMGVVDSQLLLDVLARDTAPLLACVEAPLHSRVPERQRLVGTVLVGRVREHAVARYAIDDHGSLAAQVHFRAERLIGGIRLIVRLRCAQHLAPTRHSSRVGTKGHVPGARCGRSWSSRRGPMYCAAPQAMRSTCGRVSTAWPACPWRHDVLCTHTSSRSPPSRAPRAEGLRGRSGLNTWGIECPERSKPLNALDRDNGYLENTCMYASRCLLLTGAYR